MKSIRTCFVLLSMLLGASSQAANITVGAFPELNPAPAITIPPDTFLVPVDVSGAASLQLFQFGLLFNPFVVQQVTNPGDFTSGIYGAQFVPGEAGTESFILGGFTFNDLGLVDNVAGEYPGLLDGVTGNGTLAYILFEYVDGQEGNNPGFTVADTFINGLPTTPTPPNGTVPEPSVLMLLAGALLIFGAKYRRT